VVPSYEVCRNGVAVAEETGPAPGEAPVFLRGLIDGMRCGILAVDRQARLVLLNEQGAQILGVDPIPERGTPVDSALAEHPQLVQVLSDVFTMTSLPNRAELDLRPGSGEGKTIGFTVSMVTGTDDAPLGAAVFFKDLTRIEHKEEQERLRDRLAALGQMAASMAHEIRNPLAAIDVSCSLVRRRLGSDAEARGLLDKITAEVRRLNETITSSLEFVRPVALDLARADLRRILERAIEVARERSGGREIEVRCNVAEPIPEFLMDRDRLRQVFENLIINAVEAVGERGTVTVEARVIPAPSSVSIPYGPGRSGTGDNWPRFEQFALVRISDTGPGIAEEKRDRIFFPFYTTKSQGSGVGLAMAKKIVNSHCGLIDVDEARGGGALFTVRLPMASGTTED
jgi:signal transduction histidine kinase